MNKGTIKRCLKRDNYIYQYRREAQSNDQFMKESGDYFYFTLNKEDSICRLVYGNKKIPFTLG